MKRKSVIILLGSIFCVVALLCFSDQSFAASAKDRKQTVAPATIQKPATPSISSTTSKVTQLLQKLMQAQTLKQYTDLLKNTSLTPSEQGILKKELAKSEYAGKLNKLFQDAKAAVEANTRTKANQKKQEIVRKQQQRLSQLNQQARESHQRQIAKAPSFAQAKVPGASTRPLGTAMKAPLLLEGLPHIISVNPQPITPGGQAVFITGENFTKAGEAAGRVSLKIGNVNTDLPLVTYHADIIQVRVPAELNDTARQAMPSILEGGVIEGRLSVHTPRGISVATVQLNIPIDESLLDPKIFSIFPDEIEPGQLVSIFGEKFLNRERGTVRFHSGSRTIDAVIVDWTTWALLVQMPDDVSGMRRTAGRIEVENYVQRRDDISATFIPIEVTEELYDEIFIANAPGRRSDDIQSGRRVFFDFDLVNGWKVADRWTHELGLYCQVERRPELGSSDPRYEYYYYTSDVVMCGATVIVQGPRGLPYR